MKRRRIDQKLVKRKNCWDLFGSWRRRVFHDFLCLQVAKSCCFEYIRVCYKVTDWESHYSKRKPVSESAQHFSQQPPPAGRKERPECVRRKITRRTTSAKIPVSRLKGIPSSAKTPWVLGGLRAVVLRTGRPILRSRKRREEKRERDEIIAGCALFSRAPRSFFARMFAWFWAALCTCIDLSRGRLRGGRARKNVPTRRGKSPEKQRCAALL